MTSAISEYKTLTREISKTIDRVAAEPEMKREIEYYRKTISNIKTIDEFLGNQRIYTFAMKAFGMKDLVFAKAMIRKVLTEGVDSPQAFSMSLADQRFREFAKIFDFKAYGPAATAFDRTQQGTIDRYLRNTLEERAGQSNEAVRLALYFDRKAPELISEFSILADKAVYAVVRTALGLPDSIAATDIDRQAKMLASRISVSDFSDSGKRTAFITRFLAMSEAKVGASANRPELALYVGATSRIELNTLMSLQSLKRFGA